jgi:hypothetical protein
MKRNQLFLDRHLYPFRNTVYLIEQLSHLS